MEILHPVAEKHRRQILYKCTWWASGMCSTRQKINSFFYHSWLSSIISLSHLKPYSPVYFTNADVPPSLRGWASLLDLQRIYVFVVESGRWWTEVWIKMDRILSVLFLRQSDQCLWFAAGVHTFEEEKKKILRVLTLVAWITAYVQEFRPMKTFPPVLITRAPFFLVLATWVFCVSTCIKANVPW